MITQKISLLSVICILISLLFTTKLYASNQGVVISQLQLGDVSSANNEFVEIYNNNTTDVDITDWCLYYSSFSNIQIGNKLTCFLSINPSTHLYLPSHTSAFAISNQLAVFKPELGSDFRFSSSLSGLSGHVRLINSQSMEIDKVGWGSAISAEGNSPSVTAPIGKVLNRKNIEPNILQDTDNNSFDFEIIQPREWHSYGQVYEVVDMCSNIDGFQSILPDNMEVDDINGCIMIDVCSNIEGLKSNVPEEMIRINDKNCISKPQPLTISELLPSVAGSDLGNEYIELYNPNDFSISLDNYQIYIGEDYNQGFAFPANISIAPNQYVAFYNNEIKFTLLNSSSYISLKYIDGSDVNKTDLYDDPEEDMSWALINGVWQYTNQLTPGAANLPTVDKLETIATAELQPCGANQYRSVETNRCRNMEVISTALAPCKLGQERNPDTNRCRSVPAVLGESSLTPCKPGQERNPETNRCRNVVSAMPKVGYALEETAKSNTNYTLILTVIGVCLAAIAYAVWEWRHEMASMIIKVLKFIKVKK